MAIPLISEVLGQATATATRAAFELTFNQTQNTVIRRLNKQIEDISTDTKTNRELVQLRQQHEQLREKRPAVEKFIFDNHSNLDKINALKTKVLLFYGDLQASRSGETVTDTEAEKLNKQREEIINGIFFIKELDHPDIADGDLIEPLFDIAKKLKELDIQPIDTAAVEDDSPVTDNRGDLVSLSLELSAGLDRAAERGSNTTVIAENRLFNLDEEIADTAQDFTKLNAINNHQQELEIQEIRNTASQFLTSVSLAFESSQVTAQYLGDSLGRQEVDTGSILNIFI